MKRHTVLHQVSRVSHEPELVLLDRVETKRRIQLRLQMCEREVFFANRRLVHELDCSNDTFLLLLPVKII